MIKKLKLSDCPEGVWKNGQGKTRQVAIFPPRASLEHNDFHWRLSSASVLGPGPFSRFENRERWLIVWKGQGLLLNDQKLLPHQPLSFKGDEMIEASLLNDPVVDMGLIYDPGKVRAGLSVLKESAHLHSEQAIVFLFIAEGSGRVEKTECFEGEFLILENQSVRLELAPDSLAYLFSIKHF